MLEAIQDSEATYRVSFFFAILVIFALWEIVAPRHDRFYPRWKRWPSNLGIMALNTIMLRFLSPIAAVGVATSALINGWGIFNSTELHLWLEIILAIILLDAAIYFQHILFHAVPILWRVHRMHHTDIDFDVTTGGRFHPIEIILSMLIKFSVVLMLGVSPIAVIIFEVLLNATAMFNHSNICLPLVVERFLRLFIVTPDMHRVHHSIDTGEMNSNFGFSLPWWDRLFGTYCAQPKKGHIDMTFGTGAFRDPTDQRLVNMLIQPLKNGDSYYTINDLKRSDLKK